MQLRTLLTLSAAIVVATGSASPVRTFWSKVNLIAANDPEVCMGLRDRGTSVTVYGTTLVDNEWIPFESSLNRYGTQLQPTSYFQFQLDGVNCGFMDYSDDSCMVYNKTLGNGRPGIGVARSRPDGTTVFETTREINTFSGFERIVDYGIDASGAIYVLGEAQTSATASSAFLARFNPNGTASWVKNWYKANPLSLAVKPDGGTVVMSQDRLGNFEIQIFRVSPAGATTGTSSVSNGPVDGTFSAFLSNRHESTGFVFHTITWTLMGQEHTESHLIDTSTGEIAWALDVSDPNYETLPNPNGPTKGPGNVSSYMRRHRQTGQVEACARRISDAGLGVWFKSIPINPGNVVPQVSQVWVDEYLESYLLYFGDPGKTHLVKYAPNGTKRWDHTLNTPGENAIQSAYKVTFEDILISSYSFGASQTGSWFLASVQQSAFALNDSYNVNKNAVNTPNKSVLNNDRYAKGATLTVTQQPAHGTVQLYSNGIFRYTPESGYTGPDSFKYSVNKAGLDPSVAQVGLNVR